MSKTIAAHKLTDEVIDDGDGEYFVYMVPGWQIDERSEQHCFGATGVRGALYTLRNAVPCKCDSCLELIAEAKAKETEAA